MIDAISYYGTQALTMIPLGVFLVVLLWGFFQRGSTRGAEESQERGPS
jgi:hypothetical protein